MALTSNEMAASLQTIHRWRLEPDAPVDCPRCGGAGLHLEDRSARPYSEWYHLACQGCGLDETIHIPLAPPTMDPLD